MHNGQIGETEKSDQLKSETKKKYLHTACMLAPIVLLALSSILILGLLAAPACSGSFGIDNISSYDFLKYYHLNHVPGDVLITLIVVTVAGLAVAGVSAHFVLTKKWQSLEYIYFVIAAYLAQWLLISVFTSVSCPLYYELTDTGYVAYQDQDIGAALVALPHIIRCFRVLSVLCLTIDFFICPAAYMGGEIKN